MVSVIEREPRWGRCLLMAQSGHPEMFNQCPLSGVPGNAIENTGLFIHLAEMR
jgi:hypothetical protein